MFSVSVSPLTIVIAIVVIAIIGLLWFFGHGKN